MGLDITTLVVAKQYTDKKVEEVKSGDGGYYTPSITQLDKSTMQVSFSASQTGMKDVPDVDIILPQGTRGDTGPQGPAGYTPVKGTDYFTEDDKAELVDSVLSALPAAEGVHY